MRNRGHQLQTLTLFGDTYSDQKQTSALHQCPFVVIVVDVLEECNEAVVLWGHSVGNFPVFARFSLKIAQQLEEFSRIGTIRKNEEEIEETEFS